MAILETLAQEDWVRASNFYPGGDPTVIGRLILAMPTAEHLPIDADHIYRLAHETVNMNLDIAKEWASAFGKLSIAVTPQSRQDTFTFHGIPTYMPTFSTELRSRDRRPLSQLIASSSEEDSALTYLLCNNRLPIKPEIALIQMLHLVDAAIITGNTAVNPPLVRLIDPEELAKLRRDNPDILLRLYGNVRAATGVPHILGIVASTALVESQHIKTQPLPKYSTPPDTPSRESDAIPPKVKSKRSYIGITSAKTPHIGHGFLLVKAFSDNGPSGATLVKLNDTGPRVAQAVAALAEAKGVAFEDVADQITSGHIGIDEIEAAYQHRENTPAQDIPPGFMLKAPNDYYRALLAAINPLPEAMQITSDSEILSRKDTLLSHPNSVRMLDGVGPTFLHMDSYPITLESGGQTTLQGLLIALAIRNDLHIVSSPRAFSKAELHVLRQAEVNITQAEGMGMSIDFGIASGTKGNAPALEDLIKIAGKYGHSTRNILPALRLVLEHAFLIPGEGESLNPNFASADFVISQFVKALDQVALKEDPSRLLAAPLRFKNVTPFIVKDFMAKVYGDTVSGKGKLTVEEARALLTQLPAVAEILSAELRTYVAEAATLQVVPKSVICDADRKIVDALRAGQTACVMPLIGSLASTATLEELTAALQNTYLLRIAEAMGYDNKQLPAFIEGVVKCKGVYVVHES